MSSIVDESATAPMARRPVAPWLASVSTALGLATVATLTDALADPSRLILLGLTDSGFLWGAAVLVVGFAAPTARAALLSAVAGLLGGTILYYLFIVVATDRWRGGTLADGSSAVVSLIRTSHL